MYCCILRYYWHVLQVQQQVDVKIDFLMHIRAVYLSNKTNYLANNKC